MVAFQFNVNASVDAMGWILVATLQNWND